MHFKRCGFELLELSRIPVFVVGQQLVEEGKQLQLANFWVILRYHAQMDKDTAVAAMVVNVATIPYHTHCRDRFIVS